jgi:peptide/nickel transport system substrate-binding protein
MHRRTFIKSTGALVVGADMLPFLKSSAAWAQAADTIVVAIGNTINSLDLHRVGTNRPAYQVTVNCYDRLVTFGSKAQADGTRVYDYSKIEPELAESWQIAPDGMSITFKLKQDAKFWDGTPVTSADVKWSFDRAVAVGGFAATQMKAGGLEKQEQFEAVDPSTFRVKLLRKSKLTLPDIAVPVPFILNSKVGKANVSEKDPWATEYFHRTPAGSGAYKLERWDPGRQIVYVRNDDWKGGPLPTIRRVIVREIPAQSTRRALIERGDIQMSFEIPAKDAKELKEKGTAVVVGAPIDNCMHVLCPNFNFEPFKDKRVRQAIAFALPYEQILAQAAYGRGVPMWGGKGAQPADISWPQPFPYKTDYDRAKDLLAQTPYKAGFEVPLAFDLGTAEWGEPTALLIQEGLARIGIKTKIDKIPGANWRTIALVEKKLPLMLDNFGGWLNTPCYYFFWSYIKGALFNAGNYDDAEMAKLVAETLHMDASDPAYAPKIKRMIAKAFDEVPRIPLWQPYLDSAIRKDVAGYSSWYHRQPDFRRLQLRKA